MNVFVLPSWYPSRANPMAGQFVLDQVQALLACSNRPRFVAGLWGHHDGALSLRDAAASFRAIGWRLRAHSEWSQVDHDGRFHAALTPRLTWTLALLRGGARGLLGASRLNFKEATLRHGRMDLIHAHVGFPAGWIAAALSAESAVPYVLTEHMAPFPVTQLLHAGRPVPELTLAFEMAAAVIAVSPALAADIRSLGLPCSDVIPNVIDTDRFRDASLRWPERSPFVFLTLGALTRRKGIDVLLDAMAIWNPAAGEARLLIGGEGPERPALERRAASLGLTDRVEFLGALRPEQVPEVMSRSHAFVLASREESFGVVLVEALASGRPVLATRCGGPEAIVEPGDGLLVAPDDARALCGGLRALSADAGSYDAGDLHRRAELRFGRQAFTRRLLDVYDRVIEGRPS